MSSDPKGPKPTSSIYDLIEEHRPLYETGGHGGWAICSCVLAKRIREMNRVSEPTPLSAEELASVKPIPGDEQWCYYCGFSWPGCFCAKAKATIDAKDTEIAALKGALEKTAEFLNGLAKADVLPIGIADIQQEGAKLDAIVLRVLAGKEAQG